MTYCPKCRDEYREGFDWCPFCRCALVASLPPLPKPAALEPVPLIQVEDTSQYAILQGLLEEAQIPFYARDEGSGSFLRIVTGQSIFEQTIYVNQSDYAAAIACLDGYYNRHPDSQIFALTEEEEAEGAQAQQAENDTYRGFLWFLLAFAVVVLLLWICNG